MAMKQTDYSSDFERVWDAYRAACSPANFGHKYEAYREWLKLEEKPDPDMCIEAMRIQLRNDRFQKSKNLFVPPWKHCCRWIKYKCWEGLIDIAGEQARKKQAIEEKRAKKKVQIPEHELLSPDINIAEQFKEMLERRRNEKNM